VILKKRVEIHLTLLKQRQDLEIKTAELKDFNDNLKVMVANETRKVLNLQGTIMETVVDLVEGRDDITGGHISRTTKWLDIMLGGLTENGCYADEIASWDANLFLQSSRLHDLGKIAISDSILKKPGPLTGDEFTAMKEHTTIGAQIIDKISESLPDEQRQFLLHARALALRHHEKWNGTGYPGNLSGADIPLEGRLMAVTYVYDALISNRPYKEPFSHEKATQIIIGDSGSHFDPLLIEVFREVEGKFKKHME
jgi:putative two-component system response regulator